MREKEQVRRRLEQAQTFLEEGRTEQAQEEMESTLVFLEGSERNLMKNALEDLGLGDRESAQEFVACVQEMAEE